MFIHSDQYPGKSQPAVTATEVGYLWQLSGARAVCVIWTGASRTSLRLFQNNENLHLPRPLNHCCSCCCSSLVSKLASTAPRELHKCSACDWLEGVSSTTWYVELGQNSAWKRIRRMKHSMFAVWEKIPSFRYYHLNLADNEIGEY